MTTVELNLLEGGRPYTPIWRYIGYDEPNYTYTPMGRELLGKLAGMSTSAYHARCHFLFCNGDGMPQLKWGSTNVYSRGAGGTPVYHWDIIDQIFDTYMDLGIIPFVELGFTPQGMSSAPEGTEYQTSALRRGWSYPPENPVEWADLIKEFATHCADRYGRRRVTEWLWELWNEPDIGYFSGTVDEYCVLFDWTEYALHSVCPWARLGGPSTTNPGSPAAGRFLADFLAHCRDGVNAVSGEPGTRLDFISFHAKGADLIREPEAPKQTPTVSRIVGHVDAGLEIVSRFSGFVDLPIHVSECDPDGWAAGTRYDNPNLEYRNNEYYASYFAAVMGSLIHEPRVDSALTWAFEFEDRELFEGMRTLSTNGLDKAVLNVFRLFERLGPLMLNGEVASQAPEVTLKTLATRWEDGRLAIMVIAHHDDWDVTGTVTVSLVLANALNSPYRLSTTAVDSVRGNAYASWIAMDRPKFPSESQMRELRDAALLVTDETSVTPNSDGSITVTLTMENRSVTLLELNPIRRA
ncbi:MAG: hypothetical protein E4H09_00220 [Spirochaetales bacterium]|nr:MAG: hypothetical protein E4H09_00220 [Spirochaetales bacterium]